MKSTCEHKFRTILMALKMRIYLSFGFGYSRLFPARDTLLIRAEKTVRRRVTFIQRAPSRIVALAAVGLFISFFIKENKAGLITVLFLLPSVIIPVAALLGAFMTSRVDSLEVCLRREYARLRADLADAAPRSGLAVPGRDTAESMRDYRTT